jgi:hypothetical protein
MNFIGLKRWSKPCNLLQGFSQIKRENSRKNFSMMGAFLNFQLSFLTHALQVHGSLV